MIFFVENILAAMLVVMVVIVVIMIILFMRIRRSLTHYERAVSMLEVHLLKRMSKEELEEYHNDQDGNRKKLWTSIGWTFPVFSRRLDEESSDSR